MEAPILYLFKRTSDSQWIFGKNTDCEVAAGQFRLVPSADRTTIDVYQYKLKRYLYYRVPVTNFKDENGNSYATFNDLKTACIGFAQQGSNLNQIPFVSDLVSYFKTRSGMSLIDSIAADNVSILPVCQLSNTAYYVNTDIIPDANTIVVFKGTIPNVPYIEQSKIFASDSNYASAERYRLAWSDLIGYTHTSAFGTSNIVNDGGAYVFIIYDKRLWRLPITTELTDASILNAIATVTPIINITTGSWTTTTQKIRLLGQTNAIRSSQFIGNLIGGVITWQRKFVFSNTKCCYDILTGTRYLFYNNLSDATGDSSITHTSYGYDFLTSGYSRYYKAAQKIITTPINALTAPTGYIKLSDNLGDSVNHNLADSVINFTAAIFDRSNATIYNDLARGAGTYYNASFPKRWHIDELNRLLMNDWLQPDYKGRWFVKITPNSVDIEDRAKLIEVFTYATNKAGADFDKVVKYTNDFSLL